MSWSIPGSGMYREHQYGKGSMRNMLVDFLGEWKYWVLLPSLLLPYPCHFCSLHCLYLRFPSRLIESLYVFSDTHVASNYVCLKLIAEKVEC